MALPTQVTIRPAYTEEPIFGVRTNGDTDTIARSDVMRAANPMHQIPFVSQVYEAATGETGSSVAKLVGGAIIGGPIGFLASLASVIFEQQTGESVGTAIASAFTGSEDAPVQVAQADTSPHLTAATEGASVMAAQEPAGMVEILPPEKAGMTAEKVAEITQNVQMQMASSMDVVGNSGSKVNGKDSQILSLFGGQGASAHQSYQRAQMLPYLKDVSTSMVL